MHPRSKHWHQLDLIITRRSQLNNVRITRSYHSADCDTDHALVCSKIQSRPKKLHRARNAAKARINAAATTIPQKVLTFQELLESKLENYQELRTEDHWRHVKDVTYEAAMLAFGKSDRRSEDWFGANIAHLQPLIEAKRLALQNFKLNPTSQSLEALREARRHAKEECKKCANNYWSNLCARIQSAADTGNVKGMFDGIKRAIGPTQIKLAPLKSSSGEIITEKSKLLECWVEHYSDLYGTASFISPSAINHIERLPTLSELDEMPTKVELREAIKVISSGKAPGQDGIPAEIFKCGGDKLLDSLFKLLCKCWELGSVPQDFRDCSITNLYKNKGDRSDRNNYRGISLLCIAGKLFARVALNRLQKLAERVYPESQCGFRSNRSTVDMIFSLRQLQEKCREQQRPLFVAFIDLTKAFDSVSRDGLFHILPLVGCPPKLLNFIKSFHDGTRGTVKCESNSSEAFDINIGVKQGCVLAPTLFNIFFSVLLRHAFGSADEGILLRTRSDGKLFNPARLRAKTKVRKCTIRDLLFADDAALVAHSESELQSLLDRFSNACADFSLAISLKKTKVMHLGSEIAPTFTINDFTLDVVPQFTYLGSTTSANGCLDVELGKRIGKAVTTMTKLSSRVWENKKLTISTKITVYRACILSTLLYGSESWTTYARQEKRLNTFHMRCLRRILGIHWSDKVTNNEVLERSGLPTLFTLLRQRRLRWLGHVCRMENGRIPKDLLYGELAHGSRPVGRPKLRFKDSCKRDMLAIGLDVDNWEKLAEDRSRWRSECAAALNSGELELKREAEERRQRRKASEIRTGSNPSQTSVLVCRSCGRTCASRIGLFSHGKKCQRSSR
ncbi:uncharacterized protein LOC125563054 [Nematostella vectensis]|uniref:uncharacterized protein LOC125563054 n=1 Tax=Nematostella vectensis TaxID=45351 RepID=UPI002076F364|nr:uncharacterized protein LOC125563054 [Nematostella vectensis]